MVCLPRQFGLARKVNSGMSVQSRHRASGHLTGLKGEINIFQPLSQQKGDILMDGLYSENKKSVAFTALLVMVVLLFGYGLARAAVIEGKFDTPEGMNIISGNFISTTLSPGTEPAIDAQIQTALQSGGFQYVPLGMSITGEARGCKNGIISGNLYLSTDPRLTAIWGGDAIIFIPAGMICGTAAGVTPFGAGEAILVVYTGPQVPSGYFGSVDALMTSGSNIAISEGMNGMFLSLSLVP
jgi:hypothetical protein